MADGGFKVLKEALGLRGRLQWLKENVVWFSDPGGDIPVRYMEQLIDAVISGGECWARIVQLTGDEPFETRNFYQVAWAAMDRWEKEDEDGN